MKGWINMKEFIEKYVNYHLGTIIVGMFLIVSIVFKMYGNYFLSDIVFLLAILIGTFSELILLKYINNNQNYNEKE